ncbi:MAG: hypothetical protein AAFW69_08160 [Pseudomonadota bacterium]
MAMTDQPVLARAGQHARRIAALLISGVWRRVGFAETERRLAGLPVREQAVIVGAVFGGLFCLALFFAQWGIVGLLIFLMTVVLLAR